VLPKGEKEWQEVYFPPLPETEDEVRAIARIFGVKPQPPDVLLGLSASETGLRQVALRQYRYLHFATHADLPGTVRGIREPFLILGQVENRGSDDGFLTLSEVLGLGLDADLVVLSACSTGRGKLMEGEGVANFAGLPLRGRPQRGRQPLGGRVGARCAVHGDVLRRPEGGEEQGRGAADRAARHQGEVSQPLLLGGLHPARRRVGIQPKG
jgi:hypothetical protein